MRAIVVLLRIFLRVTRREVECLAHDAACDPCELPIVNFTPDIDGVCLCTRHTVVSTVLCLEVGTMRTRAELLDGVVKSCNSVC